MKDVFISYSWKDAKFADQLHEALKKINRDTWIDWRSIPAGAKWKDEIFAGIEAAHNFVFIVSPDSVSSKMCMEEVTHAAANKKRLISILLRNPTVWPPLLESLQSIPFERCGFEDTVSRLVTAIDTDLDWVKMHTRLGARAKEWEREGGDNSFLLRGRDLRLAEEWRTESADNAERRPTSLHLKYLDASKQAESKRQRVVSISAISVAAIFAVLLIVASKQTLVARKQRDLAETRQRQAQEAKRLETSARREAEFQRAQAVTSAREAIRQRNIAEDRRSEAERQRRAALARQLAAQAASLIKDQPDLSALLSVESIHRRHLLENDHSLRRVLPFVGRLHTRQPPNSPGLAVVGKAEFSVAGGLVSGLDYLILLDPDLRKQFLEIDKELGTGASADSASYYARSAATLALSADGRYVATGSRDGTIRIFDSETGRQVTAITSGAGDTLAMSSRGQYVASGGLDGTMRLYELATDKLLSQNKIDNGDFPYKAWFCPQTFSPDDLFLPVAPCKGKIIDVVSTVSGSVRHFKFNDEVDAAVVALGGRELVVWAGKTLKVLTIPEMKERWHVSLPDSCCIVNLSHDGRYLALTGSQGEVQVFELDGGKQVFEFRRFVSSGQIIPRNLVLPVAFSPSGQYIAFANPFEESLSVVDLNTGTEVSTLLEEDIFEVQLRTDPSGTFGMGVTKLPPEVHNGLGPIAGFAFSADGRNLEVAYRFSSRVILRPGKSYPDDNETLVAKYAVDVEDLIPEVCSRVSRNLTPAEWKQYVGDEPYQKTCPGLP